jgi:glyoxylase-like metal-dependent hydrolase (beta-lactamase superfamily II)
VNEIVPGIFHWTAAHPGIGALVSSYYVEPAGLLIDPMEPEQGMAAFDRFGRAPQQIVLTIGLHWRDSSRFREHFGIPVLVSAAGMHRFEGSDRRAEPFEFGDELAPGVTAVEIGGIAPDDTALHIDHGDGAVAFADALIRYGGELGFVPDDLWGDPRTEQEAVRDSLRGLLARDFDTLLFAHGDPLPSGGHAALAAFLKPAE